jgi:hypothetical protein
MVEIPLFNEITPPDAPNRQLGLGLWKVFVGGHKLMNSLLGHPQNLGDFRNANEVMGHKGSLSRSIVSTQGFSHILEPRQ